MSNIEKEIIQLEHDLANAFNSGDIEAVLRFFSPDLVGFSSTTHERIEGLDALRKTFEYYLKEGSRVAFNISDIQVRDFDPLAIATFHWVVTIYHDGHDHRIPGRGTHVFQHSDTGWKIVHEHFSRAHHHES
ncbi:MAG: nuclear transport factor 2 family protein [FCB group bacterium]|nr:nuclear transport factor 2 family protein [FCB group bacterium]